MKLVHFVFQIINSLYQHLSKLYHFSIRKSVIPYKEISHRFVRNDATDRRNKYHRKNSLTDIHESVLRNCSISVKHSLSMGVPIDLVDHAGQTPLYYACERGYTELVKLLLANNASHSINDLNQTSPLSIAAKFGHSNIVLALLIDGANPNAQAHDDTTALYQSSYEGRIECVYHLTAYGARVDIAKNSGATPLFVAARNGHHLIVQCLLKYGGDPCQSQRDLRSPLHTALLYNRRKCAEFLLEGGNIDRLLEQRDISGWGPLHYLSKRGSIDAGQFFLNYLDNCGKSVDLNEKDCFGNSALHIAGFNHQTEFANYLISKGSDVNQSNSFQWTYNNYLTKSEERNELDQSSKDLFKRLFSNHVVHPTSEVELARDEVEAYVKELLSYVAKQNSLFDNNLIESGSYYEGTRVGFPDEFDYMINLTEIERLSIFIENDHDPSGFGRLYPKDTDEARQILSSYLEPITGAISSEKIRKQFYQLLTSARTDVIRKEISSKFNHLKFEWTSGDKRCGTAIHAEWYGKQYPRLEIKIDVVPCVTIFSWPKSANLEWPFQDQKSQFQTIARSPNLDQAYLWRISTSKAELNYFNSLISEQKNGYLTLKILRMLNPYKCLIEKVNYTADDLITSYMFKNEFLHEVQRYPYSEQWKYGHLIRRVLAILKRLEKNFLIGTIKSFYIKNYNVIDTEDYRRFRSHEIKYIRILSSDLNQKFSSINRKLQRGNTISMDRPITQKHILRERALTTV